MEKRLANRILTNLEATATELERLASMKKVDPRVASDLIRSIDDFSDRLEIATFGAKAFTSRKAKVLQCDADERHYMNTYDNPNKVIKSEPDEPYMHTAPASFNAKAIGTFDVDRTTTVSERDEYSIRDLNQYAGGMQRQPSWARGPAGKSTRQGAAKPKTWAP